MDPILDWPARPIAGSGRSIRRAVRVAQRADLVVIGNDALVLPAHDGAHVPRQILVERLLILPLRVVFTALAFLENCLVVATRHRFLDAHPATMKRPGDAPASFGIATVRAYDLLKLARAIGTSLRAGAEERFELRVSRVLGSFAEALLPVFGGFDQFVESGFKGIGHHAVSGSLKSTDSGCRYPLMRCDPGCAELFVGEWAFGNECRFEWRPRRRPDPSATRPLRRRFSPFSCSSLLDVRPSLRRRR